MYDEDIAVSMRAGAKEIRTTAVEGFWLQVTRLTHRVPGADDAGIHLDCHWGTPASALRFDVGARTWVAPTMQDRQWLWDNHVKPWLELDDGDVGVMIGEFGVYNKTPRNVALAFLEDCLVSYEKAGFGWALWNFDGPFGILDSERTDVEYESWEGHQLDRRMLELLQRH